MSSRRPPHPEPPRSGESKDATRLSHRTALSRVVVVTYGFGRKLTFSHFATSGFCGIFLVS